MSSSENKTKGELKMTTKIERIEILEAAYANYELSNSWFQIYLETDSKFDLNASVEYENKAKGLLQAYEILTGIHLYVSQIKDEIERISMLN